MTTENQPEVIIDSNTPELAQIEKVVNAWRRIVNQAARVEGVSGPVTTRARVTEGSVCLAPEAKSKSGAEPGVDDCVFRWTESLANEILPLDLSDSAAEAFIDLGKASVEESPVHISLRGTRTDARVVARNVGRLIEGSTYKAMTSRDGTIEELNEHARPVSFKLFDALDPARSIKCTATKKAYEEWRDTTISMLRDQDLVTVEGLGTFVRNELRSISVTRITPRPRATHRLRDIVGVLEGYDPSPRSDW